VRFPPAELEEFKREVPEGERAEFVRQAVKTALRRRIAQASRGLRSAERAPEG
jgi:hypothetical protein